jgi:hypothetical protein
MRGNAERFRADVEHVPLGERFAQPHEVASAMLFSHPTRRVGSRARASWSREAGIWSREDSPGQPRPVSIETTPRKAVQALAIRRWGQAHCHRRGYRPCPLDSSSSDSPGGGRHIDFPRQGLLRERKLVGSLG